MSEQTAMSQETALNEAENSGIYKGIVNHQRFGQTEHSFNYQLYMMAFCLDELPQTFNQSKLFGKKWFNPLRFKQNDYLQSNGSLQAEGSLQPESFNQLPIKQRLAKIVNQLGGQWGNNLAQQKATMVAQCRCFGIYFSPVNFYFCYQTNGECLYMLAEVSNTPWGETHYYLIDAKQPKPCDKTFHVSPFMDLNMRYHWTIKPPTDNLLVKIENHNEQKLFSATLALKKHQFNRQQLGRLVLAQPLMTGKIFIAIYWQALKLLMKKVPFISHPGNNSQSAR